MEILLVRHGENQANITKEFPYKTVDYPLTEKGKISKIEVANHWGHYSFALKDWGNIAHLSSGSEKKTPALP